ncbi:MAG: sulfatase-like hydrolase/transferase [Isosphaeraceae bacterium]
MRLIFTLGWLLIAAVPLRAEADPPAPNIVLILADDLGAGDLGCFGNPQGLTKNLDRMAREGTRFTRFYAASPICSPSRCGLITGQFPARWKITSYLQTRAGNKGCEQDDFLDPNAPSYPRVLNAAGYATAHFGKWHLGGGRDVIDPPKFAAYGYDEHAGTWESPEPDPDITATDWIWSDKDKVKRWERSRFFVDKTLDFLKRHPDQPCLVNLWLDDPHTPWVPSATAKIGNTPKNLNGVMVENDAQIGRLLDGLKTLGIDDKTLVIFASDHGPLPTFRRARTVGLRGSKMSLYEGGLRVPFIARWPGHVPAGKVDETTVLAAVDLFPTFCKLAGADLPTDLRPDGEDRLAALLGNPAPERSKPLFWEYGRNAEFFKYPGNPEDRSPNLAVLDGPWKLLVNTDGQGAELYDRIKDPDETTNLALEQPEPTARLTKAVLTWRKSLP